MVSKFVEIVHISDMDNGNSPSDLEKLDTDGVDAVIATGDLGRRETEFEDYVSSLNQLGGPETPVYLLSGNRGPARAWDVIDVKQTLSDHEHVHDGEWSILDIDGYTIATGGWFFGPARDFDELVHGHDDPDLGSCDSVCNTCQEYQNWENLLEGVESVDAMFHHGVPYLGGKDTELDVLNGPKAPPYLEGKHNGSLGYRNAVDRNKPAIAVGGHIHEGKGRFTYDDTIVVNGGLGRIGWISLYEYGGETTVEANYRSVNQL